MSARFILFCTDNDRIKTLHLNLVYILKNTKTNNYSILKK